MYTMTYRQPQNLSVSSAQRRCRREMVLEQWQCHYQAETVDLRYFFHSGWSS